MPLMIYKWEGEWLRRADYPNKLGLAGWALSAECCCTDGCCACDLPWNLNGVFEQTSPASPECIDDELNSWDGETFTMSGDPDQPANCPQRWSQDAVTHENHTCEFECEIRCENNPADYQMTIIGGSFGDSVTGSEYVLPDEVICCDEQGGFKLVYTVKALDGFTCCNAEDDSIFIFKITITGTCPE